MKKTLHSVLIIPNNTKDNYLREVKVNPIYAEKINRPPEPFYVVRLVPLPIAKKWGNQHYSNITVIPNPKFRPYEICVFKKAMPAFFTIIDKEVKKWLKRTDLTDTELFPRQLDLNIVLPDAIVEFDLGQEVFAARTDITGDLAPVKIQCYDDDKHIIQKNLIIRTSRTFLYGEEANTPEIYIERAKKQILAHSIPLASPIMRKKE